MSGETPQVRFVALGDSFTEGVGDELPDGAVRGWADIAAHGWADAIGEPIAYANLAIRGKLIAPIVEEQLEVALALGPTHLSFNGGGNDMLRPRTSPQWVADRFRHVLRRCDEEGVRLILLSGANPSAQLPLGRVINRRGDALSVAVLRILDDRPDVIRALNWHDGELADPSFWAPDKLHMNSRGHHRVAARVLDALGFQPPAEWWHMPEMAAAAVPGRGEYFREHLGPWIKRRLTGTSSGDGRAPKYGEWTQLNPLDTERRSTDAV